MIDEKLPTECPNCEEEYEDRKPWMKPVQDNSMEVCDASILDQDQLIGTSSVEMIGLDCGCSFPADEFGKFEAKRTELNRAVGWYNSVTSRSKYDIPEVIRDAVGKEISRLSDEVGRLGRQCEAEVDEQGWSRYE
jgi:hypothetical protein